MSSYTLVPWIVEVSTEMMSSVAPGWILEPGVVVNL